MVDLLSTSPHIPSALASLVHDSGSKVLLSTSFTNSTEQEDNCDSQRYSFLNNSDHENYTPVNRIGFVQSQDSVPVGTKKQSGSRRSALDALDHCAKWTPGGFVTPVTKRPKMSSLHHGKYSTSSIIPSYYPGGEENSTPISTFNFSNSVIRDPFTALDNLTCKNLFSHSADSSPIYISNMGKPETNVTYKTARSANGNRMCKSSGRKKRDHHITPRPSQRSDLMVRKYSFTCPSNSVDNTDTVKTLAEMLLEARKKKKKSPTKKVSIEPFAVKKQVLPLKDCPKSTSHTLSTAASSNICVTGVKSSVSDRENHLPGIDINCLEIPPLTPTNFEDDLPPTQQMSSHIFIDVIAYVEVRSGVDNRSMGVKAELRDLGATVSEKFTKEVTHVIFKEGLWSTYKKAIRWNVHVVSVLWIEECKNANCVVSESLYPPHDMERYMSYSLYKKFRRGKSMQPDFEDKLEEQYARRRRKKLLREAKNTKQCGVGVSPVKVSLLEPNEVDKSSPFSDNVCTLMKLTGLTAEEVTTELCRTEPVSEDEEIPTPLAIRLLRMFKNDKSSTPKSENSLSSSSLHTLETPKIYDNSFPSVTDEEKSNCYHHVVRQLHKDFEDGDKNDSLTELQSSFADTPKDKHKSVTPTEEQKGEKTSPAQTQNQYSYTPSSDNVSKQNAGKLVIEHTATVTRSDKEADHLVDDIDSQLGGAIYNIPPTVSSTGNDIAALSRNKCSNDSQNSVVVLTGNTVDCSEKAETNIVSYVRSMLAERNRKRCESKALIQKHSNNANNPSAPLQNKGTGDVGQSDYISYQLIQSTQSVAVSTDNCTLAGHKCEGDLIDDAEKNKFIPLQGCRSCGTQTDIDVLTNFQQTSAFQQAVGAGSDKTSIPAQESSSCDEQRLKNTVEEHNDSVSLQVIANNNVDIQQSPKPAVCQLEILLPECVAALRGKESVDSGDEHSEKSEPRRELRRSRRSCVQRHSQHTVTSNNVNHKDVSVKSSTKHVKRNGPSSGKRLEHVRNSLKHSEEASKTENCISNSPDASYKSCRQSRSGDSEEEAQNSNFERELKCHKKFVPSSPIVTSVDAELTGVKKDLNCVPCEAKSSSLLSVDYTQKLSNIESCNTVAKSHYSSSDMLVKGTATEVSIRPPRNSLAEFQIPRSDAPDKTSSSKKKVKHFPTIVCTRVPSCEIEELSKALAVLGGFELEDTVSDRTTHVVTQEPKRTLNLLKGIVRGCWIISCDWVSQSVKAGRWLDEEKFEIDNFSPAIQKCRIEKMSFGPAYRLDLLKNCGPIFVSHKTSPPAQDLQELVILCGGQLVSCARKAKVVVGGPARGPFMVGVTEQWLLDSITCCVVQPAQEYTFFKER